jgi:hypothetical protein
VSAVITALRQVLGRTKKATVPVDVAVHPALLDPITVACRLAGGHELGGPLFGVVEPSWDTAPEPHVTLLATLPPDGDLDGHPDSVTLGGARDGQRAVAALRWWRKVTGMQILHVGDWHLHPGRLRQPSGGDEETALQMLAESAAGTWIVAIAVSSCHPRHRIEATAGSCSVADGREHDLELGFFRATSGGLMRCPVAIDASLPALPPLPWHLQDPSRLKVELRLLAAAGYRVRLAEAARGIATGPMIEVALNGTVVATALTPREYPLIPPVLVVNGRHTTPIWHPGRFIIDGIRCES